MYWDSIDQLVKEHEIIINRKKGNQHPKHKDVIYPLSYGYLAGTTAIDGGGVDIFVGSLTSNTIQGVIATVDLLKKDAEIKIMYNCTELEIEQALAFFSNSKYMAALFIRKNEIER